MIFVDSVRAIYNKTAVIYNKLATKLMIEHTTGIYKYSNGRPYKYLNHQIEAQIAAGFFRNRSVVQSSCHTYVRTSWHIKLFIHAKSFLSRLPLSLWPHHSFCTTTQVNISNHYYLHEMTLKLTIWCSRTTFLVKRVSRWRPPFFGNL